jgi:hypothetical protein
MPSKSVVLIVCVGVCGLLLGLAQAAAPEADAPRDAAAQEVAEAWFNAWMSGRTAVAASLSAVPFSFDKTQEVKTLAELKKLFDQIVESKGKRDLKPTSVKVASSTAENVEVVFQLDKGAVSVSVKPGEAFRVVGFKD